MARNNDSLWDFGDDLWDKPKPKRRKTTYRKKRTNYRRRSWGSNEIDPVAAMVILIVLFITMSRFMLIKPNLEAIKFYSIIALGVIAVALVIFLVYKIKQRKKAKIAEQERIEQIPEFIKELDERVWNFVPLRRHSKEEPYQMELAWFLKNHYPSLDIEVSKKFARPDIVVDDVAIEVKWPTHMKDLKTIPDKIMRYLESWDYIFIVLFHVELHQDPEKNAEIYKEWKDRIYKHFEMYDWKVFIYDIK